MTDKEKEKKLMLKKVKIGIAIAVVILILAVAVFVYFGFQNKGELNFVNFKWTDNHPLFSSPYVHLEGTIFNSGSSTAGNVQLVIRIYNSQGTLLKTETMNIGDIEGKTYKNISIDVQYSGDADKIETELGYRPYGS